MAVTYSGDPSASDLDAVRFTTGDTDTSDPMLQDEEITWLLGETGDSVLEASWRSLIVAAAKYARLVDTSSGDLRVSLSQRVKHLREQAMEVRQLADRETGVPVPFAGGLSESLKRTQDADEDLILSRFWRDQFRSRTNREGDDYDRFYGRFSEGRLA